MLETEEVGGEREADSPLGMEPNQPGDHNVGQNQESDT